MSKTRITAEEALAFHLEPQPGKFEITATVQYQTPAEKFEACVAAIR